MDLNNFAKQVTQNEGLKKQVNIAQVKEVLRVVNKLVAGMLYKLIRAL